MTRAERIHKLCNAIKLYRGKWNPRDGKWVQAPQPHQCPRILILLCDLRQDVDLRMQEIDALKNYEEFDKWISATFADNKSMPDMKGNA